MSSTEVGAKSRQMPWSVALGQVSLGRYIGVVIGFVSVCAYLWATQPVFMTWANWQNIFRSQAVIAILAIGMTAVVLTGGIDLSVASLTAAAGIVMGLAVENGWHWSSAALVCIAAGAAMGFLNGFLIGVAKIPFFVVTLGSLSIYQSVALLLTDQGQTISLFGFETFGAIESLANGSIGALPTLLVLCAGLYALGIFVLRYTRFGRSIYAVGSNPEAARLTGINVTLVLVSVYTISGLLAGLAAIVLNGRLTASAPLVDPNLMLTVVAAVLIGGTAFTGGDGSLIGTVIGVLFLGVIQNGLGLSGVSSFWQGAVSGTILVLAVGIGVLRTYGWRLGGLRTRLRPSTPG